MEEKTYPYSYDELFETALRLVGQLDWKLVSQDKEVGTIKAETGMSLRSWGENVSIQISEKEGGNTISVASGVSGQLLGWGKDAENERTFHRQLKKLISR